MDDGLCNLRVPLCLESDRSFGHPPPFSFPVLVVERCCQALSSVDVVAGRAVHVLVVGTATVILWRCTRLTSTLRTSERQTAGEVQPLETLEAAFEKIVSRSSTLSAGLHSTPSAFPFSQLNISAVICELSNRRLLVFQALQAALFQRPPRTTVFSFLAHEISAGGAQSHDGQAAAGAPCRARKTRKRGGQRIVFFAFGWTGLGSGGRGEGGRG